MVFTFHNVSINTVCMLLLRYQCNIFTFHNVSINTKVKDLKVNLFMVFTFHNVSINTSALSILFSACSIKILDFTDFAEQLISYIYLQNRVFWI